MISYDGSKKISALQAKFEAQKIAFAPIVFQAVRAMRELGILHAIEEAEPEGITAEALAEKCNISLYGIKVLVEMGLSSDVLYWKDKKFFLTKTGWFLLHDELTKVNLNFTHDVCYEGLFTLKESIETGSPTGLEVFGEWNTVYEALASLPEPVRKSWFEFDHFYSDTSFPVVLPIVFEDKPKSLMDVGGNTGKWALQCVGFDPDVEVTMVDLPGQLDDARRRVDEAGMTGRVHYHQTNLLSEEAELPEGLEVIWMSQFLDCFSEEEIIRILSLANKAMGPDSKLYIMETFWDCQRFEASAFSLHATSLYFTNIANGNSRMYHSDDMRACVEKAGLKVVKQIDEIGVSHSLFVCQKV